MRTLRLSMAGALILGLLGGIGFATVAQPDVPSSDESAVLSASGGYPIVTDPTPVRFEDGRTMYRDYGFGGTIDTGDPRLSGDSWIIYNSDRYLDSRGSVASGRGGIDNEDGSWRGTFHGYTTPSDEELHYMIEYTGEGAYEGSSAIVFFLDNGSGFDIKGMIFPGEMPPLPEEPAAE